MPGPDGRLDDPGLARSIVGTGQLAPLWLVAPLPPAGRRRTRVLSDRLRARALALGLRAELSLEDAAAALAAQADGNQTALRRALRGLSAGGGIDRSPAVQWAERTLRLAVVHARWSGFDDTVRE